MTIIIFILLLKSNYSDFIASHFKAKLGYSYTPGDLFRLYNSRVLFEISPEIDLTFLGIKPLSLFTLAIEPKEVIEIENFLRELGFETLREGYQIWYTKDHEILERVKDYINAQKDPEMARKYFLKYRNKNLPLDLALREIKYQETGRLLGYPECCVQEFERQLHSQISEQEISQAFQKFPYISHIPCKACMQNSESPTARLNKKYEDALAPYYKICEKTPKRMRIKLQGTNPEYREVEIAFRNR